jgi:hypothetical protein
VQPRHTRFHGNVRVTRRRPVAFGAQAHLSKGNSRLRPASSLLVCRFAELRADRASRTGRTGEVAVAALKQRMKGDNSTLHDPLRPVQRTLEAIRPAASARAYQHRKRSADRRFRPVSRVAEPIDIGRQTFLSARAVSRLTTIDPLSLQSETHLSSRPCIHGMIADAMSIRGDRTTRGRPALNMFREHNRSIFTSVGRKNTVRL